MAINLVPYKVALAGGDVHLILLEAQKILEKLGATPLPKLTENVDAPQNRPYADQRAQALLNISGGPNKIGIANGFTRTIDAVNSARGDALEAAIGEAARRFQELQLQSAIIDEIDRRVEWAEKNPGKDPAGGGMPWEKPDYKAAPTPVDMWNLIADVKAIRTKVGA